MALALIQGSFTGTGNSDAVDIVGNFNVSLSGFGVATVAVQRSFDGGSTWVSVESFTADTQKRGLEAENGIKYRMSCSAYTSGTIAYRISR